MPRNVMTTEPMTWTATTRPAVTVRPCCNSETNSAEKVEKVVNPPPPQPGDDRQPPYARHCRSRRKIGDRNADDIGAHKVRNKIPGGNGGNKLSRFRPSSQRNGAPKEAPSEIARMVFNASCPTKIVSRTDATMDLRDSTRPRFERRHHQPDFGG
jgi:hypothetical protein